MKFLIDRKRIPLLATTVVLAALFAAASARYDGFASARNVANLFRNNADLGILAVGMTFVILSGGIDLSVGAVLGFSTIFVATLVGCWGVHPAWAMGLMLGLGAAMGAAMGLLIHAFALPPFLVTLGGMFFARGMAFVVNMESMRIDHPLYDRIVDFQIALGSGAFLPATVLVFAAVFVVALWLAHLTRFGRNVYAIGGSESSALLMGVPVGRTKVGVYALSGFCAALAGIVLTFDMQAGNPTNGMARELDAIATVVIGGTLLTGGIGTLTGTLVGLLIFGTIGTILVFEGTLDSSWQRIAIGALLLLFILLQRAIARGAGRRA